MNGLGRPCAAATANVMRVGAEIEAANNRLDQARVGRIFTQHTFSLNLRLDRGKHAAAFHWW